MRIGVSRWLSVSTIALGLVFSGGAFATSNGKSTNSVVEIISQGSGTCNTYAINSIKEIGGNVSGTSTGTFSSTDGSATYTLNGGKTFSFTVSNTSPSNFKINFAILKSEENVRIFYYPPGGITSDSNMKLTVNGVSQTIKSARLCYGQDGQFTVVEPEPVVLPLCSDLDQQLLDETGIQCPQTGGERVLVSLDPNKPNWNPAICTCNVPGSLTECDADAEQGEEGFCPGPNPLKALPTVIEAGNDGTWVCTTVGGTRTCYSR